MKVQSTKTVKSLGPAWKKWRKDHLMTQESLAQILGVWRETITRIENGTQIPTYAVQSKMNALMKRHAKEKQAQ